MDRSILRREIENLEDFWAGPGMIDLSYNWQRTPDADRLAFAQEVADQAQEAGLTISLEAATVALDGLVARVG